MAIKKKTFQIVKNSSWKTDTMEISLENKIECCLQIAESSCNASGGVKGRVVGVEFNRGEKRIPLIRENVRGMR